MGGVFCDEGTVSGGGDVTSYVDTCYLSKLTGADPAEGVSFASIFAMIPGGTLVRLARGQAQLLDRKVLSESVCQPTTANAGRTSNPLAEIRSKIISRLTLARQGYLSPALLPQLHSRVLIIHKGCHRLVCRKLQAFTGRESA